MGGGDDGNFSLGEWGDVSKFMKLKGERRL